MSRVYVPSSGVYVPSSGPEAWRSLLADPRKHWRKGFSVRTLACAWEAANGLPSEIAALLGKDSELLLAIPEHKVPLPGGTRESQTDLFALVRAKGRTMTIAVEGKVNEPLGPTVAEWFVNPSAGKRKRMSFLCSTLGSLIPAPSDVYYQLLHRTASAAIEANRFKTDDVAMIVHSFSSEHMWFDAFARFLALFRLAAKPGQLVSTSLPDGRRLYLGWARGNPKFLAA